ncbi:hypothetical protein PUNSTDRAFT_130507 [Punctularia strigosozonata HHB-11173 SS5]|uniref:uncharacterized protein n=1 Tax=Punctularia strigosozonata (strain HHB-11173) TaxID=741275 RepID=UPI000441653C|nr:uncharacterized protein PUNSTDRAFT_130507 [Punctularia strigosozonata HHB-11173 SS5]EIN12241.1 hypothetical protein PUNSTDRAFT_130507 [Punctularia strigosozonata HHB-11173 SS5]
MQSDTLVERGAAAVDERKDLAQGLASSPKQWEPLFRRLKQFTELVDKIAEIHPYANMAWNVLSITIIGQVKLDQSIRDLLDTLENVYDFMDQAQPLDTVKSAAKLLTALAQQTTECGWFIHDYAKNKNFLPRTASNAWKKLVHPAQAAPAMVKEYRAKFAELKSQLLDGSTIRTAIAVGNVDLVVHRVLDAVEEIAADVKMQRLEEACARGSRFNSNKRCLPETRRTILQIIADWINDPLDTRRVFLLYGPAGSATFYDMLRLGSSYCFDRSNIELTHATPVFPTIARDLSEREPQIRFQLSRAIAQDSALATSNDLRTQFRRFIVEPASQLAISGPIVIVIDALDECDSNTRSTLLSILQSADEGDALPSNFRVLVTCRPEPDIMDVRDPRLVRAQSMNDVLGATANEEDIQLYVRGQLSSLSRAHDVEAMCTQLVLSAEGLFQWAATACRFVVAKTPPLTIKQRMALVLPSDGKRTANGQLDTLYLEVLRITFSSTHPEVMENFHRVMSLLMTAIEPLSISALQDIVSGQADLDPDMLEGVLAGMGSLLSGTDRLDVVVRPLHTSFRDFILDPKRSHEFVVKPGKEEHLQFARGTLRLLLSEQLHINMCGLETSYRLNTYYLDLDDRVRKMITSSLVYSTRYWADHLEKTPCGSGLLRMAEQLLKVKFLFWLELLSLLGSVPTCASALLKLKQWTPRAGLFIGYICRMRLTYVFCP